MLSGRPPRSVARFSALAPTCAQGGGASVAGVGVWQGLEVKGRVGLGGGVGLTNSNAQVERLGAHLPAAQRAAGVQ